MSDVKISKMKVNEFIDKNQSISFNNWIIEKLGNVVFAQKGSKPKQLFDEEFESCIPYVDIKCFEKGIVSRFTNVIYANRFCDVDDVLMVWDGARSGLVGMGVKGAVGSTLTKLQSDIIYSKYLYYFLSMQYDYINMNPRGTGIPHVDPNILWNIEIAIPPFPEQQRIINHIESLFEKIDKAQEMIEEARKGFEKRKEAILAKAFRGELTAKWREENGDIENAELLLNSLNLFKSQLKKTDINDVAEAAFSEHDIPMTWQWSKLGSICYKLKYGTSTKSENDGLIPVLRMGNLQSGLLDWNSLVYTSDTKEIEKFKLIENDILFNRTNSPELVGKTSIYKGEREAIYAGYLIRIRVVEGINSDYVNYYLNSTYAKHKCYEVKTDGVSQSNINAQKLSLFDIPIPPTEEQNRIVEKINQLLSENLQASNLIDIEDDIQMIKKAILAKAFRGDLGTNNPEDEPSIELIKRIIHEK
jgi:type I restriction enzyme S subunit